MQASDLLLVFLTFGFEEVERHKADEELLMDVN